MISWARKAGESRSSLEYEACYRLEHSAIVFHSSLLPNEDFMHCALVEQRYTPSAREHKASIDSFYYLNAFHFRLMFKLTTTIMACCFFYSCVLQTSKCNQRPQTPKALSTPCPDIAPIHSDLSRLDVLSLVVIRVCRSSGCFRRIGSRRRCTVVSPSPRSGRTGSWCGCRIGSPAS